MLLDKAHNVFCRDGKCCFLYRNSAQIKSSNPDTKSNMDDPKAFGFGLTFLPQMELFPVYFMIFIWITQKQSLKQGSRYGGN